MANLSITLLRQVACLRSGSASGKGLQESTTRPVRSTFDKVRSFVRSGQVRSVCAFVRVHVCLFIRHIGLFVRPSFDVRAAFVRSFTSAAVSYGFLTVCNGRKATQRQSSDEGP